MCFLPHIDWPACHVAKCVGPQMPLLAPPDPLFCARLILPSRSRLEELAGAIRAKLAYFDELEAVAAQVGCSSILRLAVACTYVACNAKAGARLVGREGVAARVCFLLTPTRCPCQLPAVPQRGGHGGLGRLPAAAAPPGRLYRLRGSQPAGKAGHVSGIRVAAVRLFVQDGRVPPDCACAALRAMYMLRWHPA